MTGILNGLRRLQDILVSAASQPNIRCGIFPEDSKEEIPLFQKSHYISEFGIRNLILKHDSLDKLWLDDASWENTLKDGDIIVPEHEVLDIQTTQLHDFLEYSPDQHQFIKNIVLKN